MPFYSKFLRKNMADIYSFKNTLLFNPLTSKLWRAIDLVFRYWSLFYRIETILLKLTGENKLINSDTVVVLLYNIVKVLLGL